MGKQKSVKGKPHKGWRGATMWRFKRDMKRQKDIDPLYWMGNPINAMTREQLQTALLDANKIIDGQKETIYKLRKECQDESF